MDSFIHLPKVTYTSLGGGGSGNRPACLWEEVRELWGTPHGPVENMWNFTQTVARAHIIKPDMGRISSALTPPLACWSCSKGELVTDYSTGVKLLTVPHLSAQRIGTLLNIHQCEERSSEQIWPEWWLFSVQCWLWCGGCVWLIHEWEKVISSPASCYTLSVPCFSH